MKKGDYKIEDWYKCPWCDGTQVKIEKVNDNLYLVSCTNKETVASDYYEIKWFPRWVKVQVK